MLDNMYVEVKFIGHDCPKKIIGTMEIAPNLDNILPH